ncbi:ribonuclease P/MRP protein subunit Rpp1p [Monosporozyma servazzii]
MLVDLNVSWPQNGYKDQVSDEELTKLKTTLSTLHTLGYSHIALNFTVNQSDKFPNNVRDMNPMQIDTRFKDLMETTGLKIYSRITLIIDDPSKGQSLSKISQAFDIVAALPVSEKGLGLATTSLDIDILTFNYGNRLPTILKHKNICNCVNRGVKVEIVYAYALRDIQQRRQFISNVRNVLRASRLRGIVVSSGAQSALECRNTLGVSSLLRTLGLTNDQCSRSQGENASLALLNGRLRNGSYKQVIVMGSGAGADNNIVDQTGFPSQHPVGKRTMTQAMTTTTTTDDVNEHKKPKRQ